jgi:hypothetical protein
MAMKWFLEQALDNAQRGLEHYIAGGVRRKQTALGKKQ